MVCAGLTAVLATVMTLGLVSYSSKQVREATKENLMAVPLRGVGVCKRLAYKFFFYFFFKEHD